MSLVVALALPQLFEGDFYLRVLTFAFIWSNLAVAWNLFSGNSGYLSLGHAVFFGAGGMTSTLLLTRMDVSPWIGMFAGGLVAAIIAVVMGVILFRLSGIYFGLATLAVPFAVTPFIIWQGVNQVSIPFNVNRFGYMAYTDIDNYYYIALALLVLTTYLAWWIDRNRLGYYLRAIKGSEEAAESLGVDTLRYKLYAFTLSGFVTGLLGTLYVQANFVYSTPSVFGLNITVQSIVLPVAGGIGTLFGPIVAGMILYPLTELVRSEFGTVFPGIVSLIYGIVLIGTVLYLPNGIYADLRRKLLNRIAERDDRPLVSTGAVKESERTDRGGD